MLKVPELNDSDFSSIFERARSHIPTLTSEWTNYNYHDPGITTLHTFSWMIDLFHNYIDQTNEKHRLKYLKLLGLIPSSAAASCPLVLTSNEPNLLVRQGARFAADSIVFEASETYQGSCNQIVQMINEVDGERRDLSVFMQKEDSGPSIFTTQKGLDAKFYLGFQNMLKDKLRLWIKIADADRRNPFKTGFSLCKLSWEFYDGTNWQSAQIVEDETGGFLRSGFVVLALDGKSAEFKSQNLPQAHYLRCTATENNFDVAPRLAGVEVNCLKTVQTDTLFELLELTADSEGEITLDYQIQPEDRLTVAVLRNGEYHIVKKREEAPLGYLVRYEHSGAVLTFEPPLPPESSALISISRAGHELPEILGVTSGCAEEKIEMDCIEDVYTLKIGLLEARGEEQILTVWNMCSDMSQAGCEDRVFIYEENERRILFGNAINGVQPSAGQEVVIMELKRSKLKDGNVLSKQINRVLEPNLQEIKVKNPMNAVGGKCAENSGQLITRMEQKLFSPLRAVNTGDYQYLIQNAPGLMIDLVNVIPMQDYADIYHCERRPNAVVIAVKPHSDEQRPILSENSREYLMRYLQEYRLLTTEIKVVSARYAKVMVNGIIQLRPGFLNAGQQVEEELRRHIDYSYTGGFGKNIPYGRIFSALEMLECVQNVVQLYFDSADPSVSKNPQGDIVIAPDCLTYLGGIKIEYKQ